jgi:hypothetical protein
MVQAVDGPERSLLYVVNVVPKRKAIPEQRRNLEERNWSCAEFSLGERARDTMCRELDCP